MLHQVLVSIVLLFIAFCAFPKLQATPVADDMTQSIGEPLQQPVLRSTDPDAPQMLNVRLDDPPLNEMAQWLSTNFGLPNAIELPRVERVPAADLYRLRYKALLPLQSQAIGGEHSTPLPEYRREVIAVYDDAARTIFLPETWTGKSAADQSVLVHEMVHHLQNMGGLKYECTGAREKLAYLAQDQWLKAHGLDLEKEFKVDMFTVVALSACMN
jgi:hypothetical protein